MYLFGNQFQIRLALRDIVEHTNQYFDYFNQLLLYNNNCQDRFFSPYFALCCSAGSVVNSVTGFGIY